MAAIILPDHWRRQPTGPVELRDDGLASGIVAIIAPVPGDPYRILGSGGLPLIRLGSGDIALRGDGASMAGVSLPVVLGDEISLFAAGRITRAAGVGVNVAVCSSAGDQLFGAQFSTTSGSSGRVLHRQSNGGTAAVLNYTAPQTVSFFDYATFGATSLDTGSSLSLQTYWQGQYDSAVNTPVTGTNASYDRFSLGGAWRSSSSYAAAGNDMAIGIAFNRILSPAEYAALHENPWQVYKRSRRVLYFDAGAGGPATHNLSGSAVSALASTLSAEIDVAINGVSVTTSTGTLSPAIEVTSSGSAVSVLSGSISPSLEVALSGESVATSAGTVSSGSDTVLALSGSQATSSVGPLSIAVDVALSGQSVSAETGIVGSGSDTTQALSGSSVATQSGTLAQDTDLALTGQNVTTESGFIGAGADVTKALTGSQVTVAQQTLYSDIAVTAVGAASTVVVGSIFGNSEVGLLGIELTPTLGAFVPNITCSINGSQAITYTGILTGYDVLNIVRNVVARNAYLSFKVSKGVQV